MKRRKAADDHRYAELYRSNRDYRLKSRQVIAKAMLEAAHYRRAERHQINPRLGYFKDKTFVEGSMVSDIKSKIAKRQKVIQ